MNQTIQKQWWKSNDNVIELTKYLRDNGGLDFDDVMNILEKPWHYETEWNEYQTSLKIDEGLDAFDRRDK